MKKRILSIGAALCAVVIAGCTLSLAQKQAIAKTAGTTAVAIWRGTDNPSAEDLANASAVVEVIRNACSTNSGAAGSGYYERLYPVAADYIAKNVAAEKQPMALLGAGAVLSGIDMMFAMNPEWATKTSDATAIVGSFCEGAQVGLSMPASSPVIQAAMKQVPVRIEAKRIRR